LEHIVATATWGHINATMILETIVAFVIRSVAPLMSLPMIWYEEHLWNFSVLQRVHLSNLVMRL
jgi:hypothetical protein